MQQPAVFAICATKGRHRCAERILGFFAAQDYKKKYLLIYNNHETPQQLDPLYPLHSQTMLINQHIDQITGKPYENLGAIYRDAVAYLYQEVVGKLSLDQVIFFFMDDDDGYMSYHISDGVEGWLKAREKGYQAYRPDKFIDRYLQHWRINQGMYVEPTIFVTGKWVCDHGFDMVTGAQHHGWLRPLLEQSLLLYDYEARPTFVIDWSQEIPTWKTSGAPDGPGETRNWNAYIEKSQDHGDGVLSPADVKPYYEAVLQHLPEAVTTPEEKTIVQEFFSHSPKTVSGMHYEVDQFLTKLKSRFPAYFLGTRVLEVGSMNINGSVRPYFENANYLGLDLGEGPGVDLATPIHEFPIKGRYDVVVSTEMLEHDVHWEQSLEAMYDALKPGGLLMITCAGPARAEHGTTRTTPGDSPFTTNYYRNISPAEIQGKLPREWFTESEGQLVRGDNDTWFWGIKAKEKAKPATPFGELQFISAQPDGRRFAAEVEIQINNLAQWGLDERMHVLVYWAPEAGKPSINPDWLDLKLRYPKVKFTFYKEVPSELVMKKNRYYSVIRPWCLAKYWREHPELASKPVFYMDSDVVFIDRPDIEKMEMTEINYLTNVGNYLDMGYMQNKAREVGLPPHFYIDMAAKIVGIPSSKIAENNAHCGGAQYVLKGVTAEFWDKVFHDCYEIRIQFSDSNEQYFRERGAQTGKSAEDAGIQSWCADMWAVLYNLYYFNLPVQTPNFMGSIWMENTIQRLQEDMKGFVILHNAGASDPAGHNFFCKNNYNPGGKYFGRWPWQEDLTYVNRDYASFLYAKEILRTKEVRDKDPELNS